MHKDTLANIVIKAVRQANSVIDSSYEFPEVGIRTNEEIEFRNTLFNYCNACHEDSKKEERAAYTEKILEHVASVQANEDYGKRLPGVIKSIKTCRNSTKAAFGCFFLGGTAGASLPNFTMLLISSYGIIRTAASKVYDIRWHIIHGKPLEKKLIDEYYDYSLQVDTAKELKAVAQKDFNEAIFEHWEELIIALEDVSEQEKKRLLGKKSRE